jgi:hypothetical protein
MSKNYAGWKKGYLNKGERIAYARKMHTKTHCLMPSCDGPSENMGYCLTHFPKKSPTRK